MEVSAETQTMAFDDEGYELEERGEDLACGFGSLDFGSSGRTYLDHAD